VSEVKELTETHTFKVIIRGKAVVAKVFYKGTERIVQ
jgi:hypothetical protein